ncbi:MAG: CDP-alcohol phosphatidyltransferase family protein [Chthoniobacterales bacterium]
MESRPQLLVLANAPAALFMLCGISLVERLLRNAQRLGFRYATVLTNTVEAVTAHLSVPSWARADISLRVEPTNGEALLVREVREQFAASHNHALIVSAGFYCDVRLLRAMIEQKTTTLLVDSAPPFRGDLLEAAALLDRSWISQQDDATALLDQLASDATVGRIQSLDAAMQPTYLADLRKHVRPLFFPAPPPALSPLAERVVRDAAQNGALDFPALVHAPIETWLVSHLCQTSITPNQVTFATMVIGLFVTILYASGHLWFGTALALLVGVMDGVDGKLARTKVETTELGKSEHTLDYAVELSWWTALAYHFHERGGKVRAYSLLGLLIVSDLLGRLAKRSVKRRDGRNLDDVSAFDRCVRYIGGRRNIYVWIFAFGLTIGNAQGAFILLCLWAGATAAVHVLRALQIRFRRPIQRF